MSGITQALRYQWGRVVRRATGRDIADDILARRWRSGGRLPWSEGYIAARRIEIAAALSDDKLLAAFAGHDRLPAGYGFRLDERLVEYPWVFARLPAGSPGLLLDAGSTFNYTELLDHPRLQGRRVVICTLAPEVQLGRPNVSYLYDDLRDCCLRETTFETVVSISTLEHIGLDNTYYTNNAKHAEVVPDCSKAVRELRRVLRPGGTALITVPFGRPDNLGWLKVFDSAALDTLVADFGGRLVERHFYRYGPDGWQTATETECGGDCYYNFPSEQGRPAPDGAVAARAVACLRFEV